MSIIKEFEKFYSSSLSIENLRGKVLQLAVEGKLVNQDCNDFSVKELLSQINEKRNQLIKEKKIRKPLELEPINKDIIPYMVPKNWKWARLGDICFKVTDGSHNPPKGIDGIGYPMLSAVNINKGIDFSKPARVISAETFEKEHKRTGIQKGDVLLTIVGTIGRAAVVETDKLFTLQRSVAVLKTGIDSYYLRNCLLSPFVLNQMIEDAKGTAQKGIYLEKLNNILVPIPPLEEQVQIVKRVSFLMSQIDKVEEKLLRKEQLLNMLPQAVVDAIGNCHTSAELKKQLEFVIKNLDSIFQTPESMQELRNVILQLAIEGKLVSQEQSDEPANELIKRIRDERDQLVKEKKIKKPNKTDPIDGSEIPFEVPESWEWTRLGDIGYSYIGLTYKPSNVVAEGLPVLRSNNIRSGKINHDNLVYVNVEAKEDIYLVNDDLLICARNGSKRLVGKSALIDEESVGMTFGAFMTVYRSNFNYYVYHFLNSKSFRNQLGDANTTTVNQITQGMLRNILIPLPPIEEQKRIVDRVESLFRIVDEMEFQLKKKINILELLGTV